MIPTDCVSLGVNYVQFLGIYVSFLDFVNHVMRETLDLENLNEWGRPTEIATKN